MAGGGDIIQNIVLAGQSDVIAGLSSIGQAGVQAFSTLEQAVQNVSFGGPLAAITGFTAAIATVTAGFFEWSAASSNATIRTANFGDELGTSAQQMTTLITALAQGGNQVTDLTTSFRRLAVSVESEWPTIQKSVRNATNQMREDYIKVGETQIELQFSGEKLREQQQRDALDLAKSTLGVREAKQNLVKTDTDAAIQMQANAVDVLSATAQLSQAEFALAHIRTPASREEKIQQAEQQAQIAALQAQVALQRAIVKQAQEAEEAEIKHRQAVLQVQEAQQRVREAQTKAAEDARLAPLRQQKAELDAAKAVTEQREHEANSIANLKQYVDNLATGASNANSKVQLSSSNLVKGLIASIGPGVSAVEEFKGSLGDLGLAAPKLYDVMLKVSDIFKNTTDETLRAAIATALFGRGYSFSLVEALSKGSEAIKASQAQIAQTFDLTKARVDEQVNVAREFRAALNSLAEGVGLVSKQISTVISPIFTVILREIETVVEDNRTKFLGWAQAIRDFLTPAITGFISSITGVNLANAFNLSPEQILRAAEWKQTTDNIRGFITAGFRAVGDFITGTLPKAFDIVMQGFNAVAGVINFFGGSVTGTQVAIALLIGQFTGLNNVLVGVGFALGGLIIALAANPWGLIVLGVAGAIGALALLAIKLNDSQSSIRQWLDSQHDVSFGLFDIISEKFDDLVLRIKRGAEDAKRAVQDMLSFKTAGQIVAENQKVATERAKEDAEIARQRSNRNYETNNAPGELIAYPGSSGADIKNQPKTVEDAYKSLGTVIQDSMAKAKKTIDEVTDSTKNMDDASKKASKSFQDQQRDNASSAVKAIQQVTGVTGGGSAGGNQASANFGSGATGGTNVPAAAALGGVLPAIGGGGVGGGVCGSSGVSSGFNSGQYYGNSSPSTYSNPADADGRSAGAIAAGIATANDPYGDKFYGRGYGGTAGTVGPSGGFTQLNNGVAVLSGLVPEAQFNNVRAAQQAQQDQLRREGKTVGVNETDPLLRDLQRTSAIDDLANDWRSQRRFNAQMHAQGADDSPYAKNPESAKKYKTFDYEKPIAGHYDKNQHFVPDEPVFYTDFGRQPHAKTDDYYYAGEKNPAGPYQSGISAPIGFDRPANDEEAEENRRRRLRQQQQDNAPGYDDGGSIQGKPGVDTNLIWATHGEYMHPVEAVDYYGQPFMDAIRDMRIPKNMFALGGIIRGASRASKGMIPAYAGGGAVTFQDPQLSAGAGLGEVHFHQADGRMIGSGLGNRGLIEALTEFATGNQRFRMGVEPSWRT